MEKIAVTEPSESGATDEAPGRTCRPGGMQPLPEKGLQNRARAGKKYTNSFLLPAGKEPTYAVHGSQFPGTQSRAEKGSGDGHKCTTSRVLLQPFTVMFPIESRS